MSVLTVHIGNTEISVGVFSEEGELQFTSSLTTLVRLTSDQYTIQFIQALQLHRCDLTRLGGAILSSVVPDLTATVAGAVKQLIGRYPIVLGPGVKTGLPIRIENPAELGADLVAESVAALKRHAPPLLLVDIGTAIVISAIDRSGHYIGCAICPGVELSYEQLSRNTAQLPQVGFARAEKVIGKTSVQAMHAGIVFGFSSMIDGILEEMLKETGPATLLATGHHLREICASCKQDLLPVDHLLLEGLFQIYSVNTQNKSSTSRALL